MVKKANSNRQPKPKPRAKTQRPRNRQPIINKDSNLGSLGAIAGSYLGGMPGGMIGRAAGNLISQITGMGAYTVRQNTLSSGNTVPTFKLDGDGVVIAHREFLTDINGSTGFTLQSLPINPGLPSTFPWLSLVAQNFEEYEMRGLVFEYRPSSGSAVSTNSSALGVVVYATDYNVLGPVFQNKQQMESYEYSCSTVPFQSMLHPVECAPRQNVLSNLYIRSTSVPAGADARLYDMGLFEYATQGMQSVYTTGELWVSYHVALRKPRIQPNGNQQFFHVTEGPASTAATGAAFGTSGGLVRSSSNLFGVGLSPTVPTNTILFNQPGNYLVYYQIINGATATGAPTYNITGNIANVNFLENNSSNTTRVLSSPGGLGGVLLTLLIVSAPTPGTPNAVVFNGGTGSNAGQADLIIVPMPEFIVS